MILEKESELQSLTSYRLTSLQSLLDQKTSALSSITSQFGKLKEDFDYNVSVIAGRDRELKRYERYAEEVEGRLKDAVEELRRVEQEKDLERDRVKKEVDGVKDEVGFWKSKYDDAVRDADERNFRFERERDALQREVEQVRLQGQRMGREREEDMEQQRREVTSTFDEVLRVREMEGRRREEELRAAIREAEGRLSEAMGQVEAARGREVDLRAQADRDRAQAEESERALRQTKWACEDAVRVKDGKISELRSEGEELKKANTMMAEEYEGKMGELLGSLHEVEKAFVEQRAKHEEQRAKAEQAKEETIRNQRVKLESSIDSLATKLSQAEARVETLEAQVIDDRSDFEARLKEAQSKARQESAESLAAVQKAEDEARDAKGRAWTAQTELSNEQAKVDDLARKAREATVRVEELRAELSKADSAVEEARRLSKDRLTAMQREHERVLNKLEEDTNERVREATGLRDRSLAEKRVMEQKVEELEDECARLRTDLHGAKLRMRFTETAAPAASARAGVPSTNPDDDVFAALAQPSPMFSDDMGPATPLVLESMGDSSAFGGKKEDTAVEAENRKLREMVATMRKEMEELTSQLLSPEGGGEGAPQASAGSVPTKALATEALEQQLAHSREYVVLLQNSSSTPAEEMTLLRRHVQELSLTVDDLRSENDRLGRSSKSLRSQVVELERQLNAVDKGMKQSENPSQATLAAEKKVKDLEDRLGETHSELKAISADRNRLLDLSNKLRVDMLKASPKSDEFGALQASSSPSTAHDETNNPASQQLAEALRKSESALAARYEAKIHDIEDSLRTLSRHNQQVRTTIDRWGTPSLAGMHLPGSDLGTGGLPPPPEVGGVTLYDDEKNAQLLEARRNLLKAKEELAGIGSPLSSYGGGGVALSSNSAVGGGEGLRGYVRPPVLRSGAGHVSGSMTDSQREAKERLARSQRRRVELMGERRKVRNWNVRDSDEDA